LSQPGSEGSEGRDLVFNGDSDREHNAVGHIIISNGGGVRSSCTTLIWLIPGDFVAGFLLGGVIFGAIGYLIAPVVSKSIAAAEKETQDDEEVEGPPKKLPKYVEDEEGLESTRKSLNEKIAQLNAAIDNVSAQLRAEDVNESAVELESAA
jgi:uncharacterized protein YlxW (UPF0749 family)